MCNGESRWPVWSGKNAPGVGSEGVRCSNWEAHDCRGQDENLSLEWDKEPGKERF